MNLANVSDQVFRKIAQGAETLRPILGASSPLLGEVLEGIGLGAGLIADLIELGMNPSDAIPRIRSSLVDFQQTSADLESYARTGK